MGGDRLMRLADGIYARHYPSGKRAIQLQFMYRGARCRETLKGLDPDVKAHVKIAVNRAGAIREAIARGTFNYAEFFPDSPRARLFGFGDGSATVKDVGDAWLADMKLSLPHSTYRSYEGPMHRFVYPAIGKLRVRDVTPEHIREAFRSADITLKTARNYSIPLTGLFTRALDDGMIASNPMDRITLKRLIPVAKHHSDYEVDPLSEAEIAAFLAACREHRPAWVDYWTVAFYTGLRTSEQYGLEWADWRDAELRVERAVVERKVKSPKTESSVRTHQLAPIVVDALKHHRAHGGTAFRARIFWHPEHREELVDYEKSQAVFDYVCKRAGIRRRNQYQTRHTYASNMLMQGENPLFVARQMGHKDIYTLLRVYAKWIKDAATYVPRGNFGRRQVAE